MSEIKLLPCPCCNSDRLWVAERNYFGKQSATVNCLECGLMQADGRYETMTEAIESWNTRKPMERIVEKLEEEKLEYETIYKRLEKEVPNQAIYYLGLGRGCEVSIDIVRNGGKE